MGRPGVKEDAWKYPRPRNWTFHLKRIHTADGYDVEEVLQVLHWYCDRVSRQDLMVDNPDFIPVAYSGATFRKKFERIQAAMERLGGSEAFHPRWKRYAQILSLVLKKKEIRGWRLDRWARILSTIPNEHGASPHEVGQILRWYCRQHQFGVSFLTANYIPRVYSATNFALKFDRIEAARERLMEEEGPPILPIKKVKASDHEEWTERDKGNYYGDDAPWEKE